jgi:hypothetical protein
MRLVAGGGLEPSTFGLRGSANRLQEAKRTDRERLAEPIESAGVGLSRLGSARLSRDLIRPCGVSAPRFFPTQLLDDELAWPIGGPARIPSPLFSNQLLGTVEVKRVPSMAAMNRCLMSVYSSLDPHRSFRAGRATRATSSVSAIDGDLKAFVRQPLLSEPATLNPIAFSYIFSAFANP